MIQEEYNLLNELAEIIEKGRNQVVLQVNSILTFTYWQIGKRINEHILKNERAEYGEKVISKIAFDLERQFGRSYTLRNVRRMVQFSVEFPDYEIVTSVMTQLSWSHFLLLLPLKSKEERLYYANKIAEEKWSIRQTKHQIDRKSFERNEIAQRQHSEDFFNAKNTFKDPYFFDFLGLPKGFLENDLENSIIKELEKFMLELGLGFTFVERQKRIILDGKDFYIDLLFYHRRLKRLVVIELKLGDFKASYKGQMELYLNWLNKYERQEGENSPIGLILCTGKNNEQIELLEMHKDGIMVSEYWTDLPPKKELEQKLNLLLNEAKRRFENKKTLTE